MLHLTISGNNKFKLKKAKNYNKTTCKKTKNLNKITHKNKKYKLKNL